MNTLLELLQDFWGIILVVLFFVIFLITQGRAKAVQILLSLMLRLEKQAEEYTLKTGEEKFEFVVLRGYELLPRYVKMFITYSMFEELANKLYEEAKNYLLSLSVVDNQKPKDQELQERKETDPG